MTDCTSAWLGGFLGGLIYVFTMSITYSICVLRNNTYSKGNTTNESGPKASTNPTVSTSKPGFAPNCLNVL